MSFWSNLFDCFLKVKLPLWAYGLECEICKRCFTNEEAHYKHVKNFRTIRKHQGKIPFLKK